MTAQMVAAYILYYIGIVGFAAYVLISHVANNELLHIYLPGTWRYMVRLFPAAFSGGLKFSV